MISNFTQFINTDQNYISLLGIQQKSALVENSLLKEIHNLKSGKRDKKDRKKDKSKVEAEA